MKKTLLPLRPHNRVEFGIVAEGQGVGSGTDDDIGAIKTEIGNLVLRWAHLEDGCFQLFWYILGNIDRVAFDILRTQVDARFALKFCRTWAQDQAWELHSKHVIECANLIEGRIRPHRNRYVHDPLYNWADHYARTTYQSKPDPKSRKRIGDSWLRHQHFTEVRPDTIAKLVTCIDLAEEYIGSIIQNYYESMADDVAPDIEEIDKSKAALVKALDDHERALREINKKRNW